MDKAQIAEIAQMVRSLRPFSATVRKALALLDEPDSDMAAVADVIELDPVCAASVLKLANSPFYGFSRKIERVEDAAVLLGEHSLRQVLMASSVIRSLSGGPAQVAETSRRIWQHSLAVAAAARVLASRCGVDPEQAFLAGVLHEVGRLILLQCRSEAYVKLLQAYDPTQISLVDLEQRAFGYHYGIVGAVAVRLWKLPEALEHALQRHLWPICDKAPEPLVDLVHLADVLALGLWYERIDGPEMEPLSAALPDRLGLDWAGIEALLPGMDSEARQLIDQILD